MPNHTPGPWTFKDGLWIIAGRDLVVARVLPTLRHDYDGALIAAAPDVLAALIELTERCDGAAGVREDGSNIDTRGAHAAIEKACFFNREKKHAY